MKFIDAKIIRIFKESIIRQREYDFDLKTEFEEWDSLSDEALQNFEETLLTETIAFRADNMYGEDVNIWRIK